MGSEQLTEWCAKAYRRKPFPGYMGVVDLAWKELGRAVSRNYVVGAVRAARYKQRAPRHGGGGQFRN